ncbi:TonB-dependent receptor [uncultured Bacteroides sp.]|uniref:SusC/RagA family TonB-linked outer membrane protein n=1 Tax=uncultured Bacteroides sp. TaxID=162156 RepID=UPI0025DD6D75|nr:TonB-dependent receptor [uncultured Bacteroides sp.]
MKKRFYFFFLLCLLTLSGFAQEMKVTGIVTEASTGEPMPGVTIQVKGTTTGTISNVDGQYTIQAKTNDILVFSTIGMKTIERTVSSSAPINVAMEEDNVQLDQVVVIGYGSVKKSHLSGAVSSVGAKELNGNVTTSAASALQGKIAGVNVSSVSGNPNDGMTINVRGISSLSNNAPLFVIDGAFGDINMIDPNDIQSIEVLKDAAAAAIYGSRAAGGVVLISTKGGRREMPTQVDINLFSGIQQNPKELNVLNGEEYSRFARYYGLAGDGYGAEVDAVPFVGKGTDWQDIMFNNAMVYKANVNITGGSKNASFSASGGYLNRDGILRNTSHESYNIRLKSDFTFLNNRVTVGESLIIRLTNSEGNGVSLDGIMRFPAVIPVYDPTNPTGWGTSSDINLPNPVAMSEISNSKGEGTQIFLNAYLQAEIIKGLKYKLNLGLRRNHNKSRSFTGVYDLGTYGINEAPDLSENFTSFDSWVLENTLNYDRVFGKHTVSGMVGYSAQKDKNYGLYGNNSDIPEFIDTMTGNVTTMGASSYISEQALVSLFARVMYSYDDRYLFSASIRRDGSSRFKKGNRFGSFPSVSVGWNINREKFFRPLENIFDQVKLRFSYGKLGNQEMDSYYPTLSVVSGGLNYIQGNNIWFGKLPFVSAVSPDNLTWENTETYNVGLDLTLLNGKLAFTADAYVKNTNNVLLPIPYAASTGISGLSIQNAGQVQNKGIELSATWRSSIGDKANYYVGLNASTANNKVTKITAGGENMSISGYTAHGAGGRGINMFKKGHSMSYFNLIETDGIFRSMEEIENYKNSRGEMIQPGAQVGDVRYKDWNGDGVINTNDQHDVGSPLPNFTFGLRMGGDWNNFDINLFIDGMTGNKIFNYPRYCLESGANNGNLSTTVANSWRPDNPNTHMPRFSKVDGTDNKLAYTDRWLEDGSFIRFKTVDIGYTFPKQWMQKAMIQNLRVYVSMENLFTMTKYSGFTPDLGETSGGYSVFSKGIDQGRYPLPRTFSFGIQVSL